MAREVFQLVITLLTAVGSVLVGYYGGARWMWPNRNNWGARCQPMPPRQRFRDLTEFDANRGWMGGPGERWCSLRNQSKGNWYSLHIGKSHGQARMVSRIRVYHGVDGGGYPAKLLLKTRPDKYGQWDYVEELWGPLDVSFEKPRKVSDIWMEITEPQLLENGSLDVWAIYDIEVTEVRLFGSRWHSIIW